jgi:hypothetical protein
MTQERLAEKADVDRSYVQRVETGRTAPGLLRLCRFCEALGVTPNELMVGVVALPVAGTNGNGPLHNRKGNGTKGSGLARARGRSGANRNGVGGNGYAGAPRRPSAGPVPRGSNGSRARTSNRLKR